VPAALSFDRRSFAVAGMTMGVELQRVLADAVRAAIRSASPNRLRSSRSGTGDGVSEEGITAAAGTESST
jgi:hypothetical protein